ncbi:hypothetical protein N7486_004348 [Penicillium sp. IBT 16267x]|nr:hypothetical protein N7486_004348 [Penicillium sp. IBT 16267x]
MEIDISSSDEQAEASSSRFPKRRKIANDSGKLNLRHEDYTIAWICALSIEMSAARAVLDEIHETLPTSTGDKNTYVLGSIKGHDIVIACLPADLYGLINAATVVTNMKRTFTAIRVGLMVGIAGGVPSKGDIRLGDIVVGTRVMQTDLGKIMGNGGQLDRTGIFRIPDQSLGTAVSALRAKHDLEPSRVPSILQQKLESYGYGRPNSPDRLFLPTYHHQDSTSDCDECDHSKLIVRSLRVSNDPVVHYGAVASGSQVIKNSVFRDEVARQLNVICFEMEAAGLMDILPCLRIRGICDYSDSHKSKDWQKYAAGTAAAYARELIEELPKAEAHARRAQNPHSNDQSPSQERRRRLLDCLRFKRIDARKLDIKTALKATCQWLLSHPGFEAWLDPEKLPQHHGFLWISGKPGAGKSTIMKFAYLNLQKRTKYKGTVIASFFFNARGGHLEKSISGMYRSLLLQLLEGARVQVSALNILKELLLKAVTAPGQRPFTCFVDALDECDEQQVRDMIQYFEDLAEQSTVKQIPLRVCFSSRHHPYIIIRRGTRLTLEHELGHTKDLAAYVRSQLRADDPEIIQKLLDKGAGVFIWVVLVVEILNREYARGAMFLHRRLEEIPTGLSELFKDILRRDKENMEEPGEFYHALWSGLSLNSGGLVGSKPPNTSVQDTSDGVPRTHIYVISCSKGLAEITNSKEPIVQFIHESVRDFLIRDNGLYELWPELGFDWESRGHDKLKHCCNIYMTHPHIKASLSGLSLSGLKGQDQTENLFEYPFLQYACQNVLYHADAAEKVVLQTDFLSNFCIRDWIEMNNFFEKIKIRQYTPDAKLIYVLADKGHPNLIRTWLKQDPEIHVIGERYKYPLFAALARGDKATCAALLDLPSTIYDGVDITEGLKHRKDLGEYKYRTPLSWAVQTGQTEMVKLLLPRETPVNNIIEPDGHTLLSLVVSGYEATVGLSFLNDPEFKPSLLGSLKFVSIARLLIDQGADVNASDSTGRTPLSRAAEHGHLDIARLLIDRGADVNASNSTRWKPLSRAAEHGHLDIARLLIDRGANVNATNDVTGWTPLSRAARHGHLDFARLLINRGADVNASDSIGWTPLSLATEHGHLDIASLLIDRGADVNTSDSIGWTPLSQAAAHGYLDIARLLIDRGVNVNGANGETGWTPLSRAIEHGHLDLARLLIDRGADVNMSNGAGCTPLSGALKKGHEAIASLLIDQGAVSEASHGSGYVGGQFG